MSIISKQITYISTLPTPLPPLFPSFSSLLLYSISVHLWHLKVNGAGPELDLCVVAETTS